MYPDRMIDAWRAGTRAVYAGDGKQVATIVLDDSARALEIVAPSRINGMDLTGIEVRASFAGPSRGAADAVGDILLVVQQGALGAAGAALWVSVQTLIQRALDRRGPQHQKLTEPSEPPPPLRHTITVMVQTERGSALVHRETVGPQDLAEERLSIERIVQSLIDDPDHPEHT